MNFKLISIAVLVSTLSAQAGVVHIDNPRFPTTPLPFAVYVANVTQYGGTGDWSDDTSQVCQALGYGLSVGPYEPDYTDIDETSVRVYTVGTTEVDLYDVMSPTSGLQGYKALSQIDCQEIAVPFTLQRIAYFSAKDVQGLLNSALPAHFNYSADKFCKDQGFDRAGTLYTTEGTANEGSLTTVANYEIDSSGAYYIASQSIAFPEAVVCTLDK